jgi:hypothetical protein
VLDREGCRQLFSVFRRLLAAWYLVLGAWCLVLGAWCLVRGTSPFIKLNRKEQSQGFARPTSEESQYDLQSVQRVAGLDDDHH